MTPILSMLDRSLRIAFALILVSPSLLAAAEYQFSWTLPIPQGNSLGGPAFSGVTTGYLFRVEERVS